MATKTKTRGTGLRQMPSIQQGAGPAIAIREMIGRVARQTFAKMTGKSIDGTVTNYAFWDRFRRCAAKGYEISGTFARPITQLLSSWVIGEGAFRVRLALDPGEDEGLAERIDYTNSLLADFVAGLEADLLTMTEDLYALGDQYFILNPDGSVSVPSPETVTVEHDPLDYRRVVAYTIRTELDKAVITDRYTETERTITIKEGRTERVEVYDNPTGMIPVVHWSNDRSTNETHGRPIYEGLLRVFSRYDDLIEKMIDGAELMGNPIPTMEGVEDPEETIKLNGSETDDEYTDDLGETHPRFRIRFDALTTLLLGKGGSFKFATPPVGFTNDSRATLKSLFLLIMEFTRIPEAFWGNELSSARATANEQLKTFYKYIASRRIALQGTDIRSTERGGMMRLVYMWLLLKSLTDAQLIVDALMPEWVALSQQDAQVIREWAEMLHQRETITDETLVRLSGLVDDPAAEVAAARLEALEEADLFEQNMAAMLNEPENEGEPAEAAA